MVEEKMVLLSAKMYCHQQTCSLQTNTYLSLSFTRAKDIVQDTQIILVVQPVHKDGNGNPENTEKRTGFRMEREGT